MKAKYTARIFSAALAAVMLLSVSALGADIPNPAAANSTQHRSGTTTRSAGGQTYDIYSIMYIDGKTAFSSVWIETQGHVKVPSGYMGTAPSLYEDGGNVLASSPMDYNPVSNYYTFQNTGSVRFSGYIYGGGLAKLYNGSGYTTVVAPDTPLAQNRSASTKLASTLDSNGQYPVNAQGQSYGSGLLANMVGHAPDLIAATGENGVEGYILRRDIDPDVTTLREALLHTAQANDNLIIPLYDASGSAIGTFKLSPLPQEDIDAAWAAVAAMDQAERETTLSAEWLVNGDYPVNSQGQTYGPMALANVVGYQPDLISAVGENGVEGYILREDVIGPEVNTPEEALESMLTANDRLIIPLFDVEGNEIGTFHITPISEEHVAAARESLAQMRGE
ncbi:hypothetical protein CE91St41_01010 [Oscillospiraceae bacterium]|nr:hypothetical protein CE91St40_01010 [Oscillospiraceae bacterium]BDF73212.1 hypothetical protein CE91St41_01010 [Oscillospiraceae bacterium]